jgi:hypothetical protein
MDGGEESTLRSNFKAKSREIVPHKVGLSWTGVEGRFHGTGAGAQRGTIWLCLVWRPSDFVGFPEFNEPSGNIETIVSGRLPFVYLRWSGHEQKIDYDSFVFCTSCRKE